MNFIPYYLILLLHQTANIRSETAKCQNSVDITDGIRDGSTITKDGVTYTEENYYVDGSVIKGCICNVKKCIRKCCVEGETLNMTSQTCVSSANSGLDDFTTYSIINVPENGICHATKYRIRVQEFQVVEGKLQWDESEYGLEEFCLATVENSSVAIVCVTGDEETDRIIYSIGMIISMPFLLATFLVYAILPDSNLHRKALMFYVSSLLLAYVFLVTVQLYEGKIAEGLCHFLGYTVVFFFMVSFFWMNVMCLDMWFAFSGILGFHGKRNAERKRFIIYCIYAWGMPVLMAFIVFLLNTYGDPNSFYYPGVGLRKCFLEDGLPNLFYFYGPMAILITINIILFILTAVKIQKVKKETKMLKHTDSKRHSYEDDKQKFNLYLKLLFAMGINWTMEIISWAVGWKMGPNLPSYVWYLTDFCNAMYGVFIFFIFVFKKKIWRSLQKRYYVCIGKPHLAHSMTMTQATRSSNYSTTETGLTEHRLSELKNGRPEERALTDK